MSNASSMIESRSQFGSRVREIRKEQHLTQMQLGQIVGLNRSQISRIECGHGSTTLDTILLVANGLGITPSELFSGIDISSITEDEGLSTMIALPNRQITTYHGTKL